MPTSGRQRVNVPDRGALYAYKDVSRAMDMETFKLPLPFTGPHDSQLLDVSGERKLKGRANTGMFKILSIGEKLTTRAPRIVGRDEDGLALATIECDGPLELADRDRGNDPYNRLGRRMR